MYRTMSTQATTASTAYSRKNVTMLVTTHAVLTDGETPSAGLHQPLDDPRLPPVLGQHPARGVHEERQCDRPDGQPQEQAGPRQRAAPEQPARPRARSRNTSAATYAITRIDQYWMKTFGT